VNLNINEFAPRAKSTSTPRAKSSSTPRAKRQIMALILLLPMVAPAARAQSAISQDPIWKDIGGVLKQGCQVLSKGTTIPGTKIPFGGDTNLDWLCTLSKMHGWVDGALMNGDWTGFAQEVLGQYVTDLAHHLSGELGLGTFNGVTEDIFNSMKGTYNDFRKTLMGAMRQALLAQANTKSPNDGLPASTSGGLADRWMETNPIINLANKAGQFAKTQDAFRQLDEAKKIDDFIKDRDESITAITEPALQAATSTIGIPLLQEGKADTFRKEAETALSTREVAVIQTKALAEGLKQDAVYSNSMISILSEIAKGQVMTNVELGKANSRANEAQSQGENELQGYLEQEAEATLQEAAETAKMVKQHVEGATELFTAPTFSEQTGGLGDVAP
jgi:hypothetical protein